MSTLRTEDDGKKFEKVLCIIFNTPYIGSYKYDLTFESNFMKRLEKIKELFPKCIHTGSKQGQYDFTSLDGTEFLSAKTTKRAGKIAPQVIGQCRPERLCQELDISTKTSIENLKVYIQENIPTILRKLVYYTFDCPTVYYNKYTNEIRYIVLENEIEWDEYIYQWTRPASKWTNSSTLKIKTTDGKYVPLVEFQFHSKSRTNMTIRWYYENVISLFDEYMDIIAF